MDKDTGNDRLERRIRWIARRYNEGSLDKDAAWEKFTSRQGIRRNYTLRIVWGAAAVLLIIIGVGIGYMKEGQSVEWVAVETETGQIKEVILPDNSKVTLAGNTILRYDRKTFGKEKRAVEMSGKAFFHVERDEARPFSVKTTQVKIEVLGTSFQIQASDDESLLHVMTGKVRFSTIDHSDTAILTAGMSGRYNPKDGFSIQEKENDPNYFSWKTRQLRFRNTPLETVLRDVSKAYQVELVNRTGSTDDLKLTSYFDNLPLDDLILVINQTLDIQVEVVGGK